MEQFINKTLDIVRSQKNPEKALSNIITLCSDALPEENWSKLPKVDIGRDIAEAREWLAAEMSRQNDASGIYLALDTLNMDDGEGSNIQFAGSSVCDPRSNSIEWIEQDDMDYGSEHLILGLCDLNAEYDSENWSVEAYELCDYILFLGYSGIVLKYALSEIDTFRPTLAFWGFHDGDTFRLAIKDGITFTVLCN